MPPCTTKRRATTNLKAKNNQNYQKIELYRSTTTKKVKKKHSFRQVRGAEMGSRAERTLSKAAAGGLGWARKQRAFPHLCVDKLGGTTEE